MQGKIIKVKGGNQLRVVTAENGQKRVNFLNDDNTIVAWQQQGEPKIYLVSEYRVTFHCPSSFSKSLDEEGELGLDNEYMLLRMKWQADKVTHTNSTPFEIVDLANNPEFVQMMEFVEERKLHLVKKSMDPS